MLKVFESAEPGILREPRGIRKQVAGMLGVGNRFAVSALRMTDIRQNIFKGTQTIPGIDMIESGCSQLIREACIQLEHPMQ